MPLIFLSPGGLRPDTVPGLTSPELGGRRVLPPVGGLYPGPGVRLRVGGEDQVFVTCQPGLRVLQSGLRVVILGLGQAVLR